MMSDKTFYLQSVSGDFKHFRYVVGNNVIVNCIPGNLAGKNLQWKYVTTMTQEFARKHWDHLITNPLYDYIQVRHIKAMKDPRKNFNPKALEV